jgi:hypothetical protein
MAASRQFSRLLNRLVATRPGSRAARKLKMEAEHAVMRLTKAGRHAANRTLKAVRLGAVRLTHTINKKDASQWIARIGEKAPTELIVWFSPGPDMQASYVQFNAIPPEPVMTPAERARHERQEAFYKRYMEIGDRWYGARGPKRLPKVDNVILLIGELEADVNNGGFSQYLDNKGRRRALSALAALRTVGAVKTAAMLKAALSPRVTEKQLGALDSRFYKVPEDLAVMTMGWVNRRR